MRISIFSAFCVLSMTIPFPCISKSLSEIADSVEVSFDKEAMVIEGRELRFVNEMEKKGDALRNAQFEFLRELKRREALELKFKQNRFILDVLEEYVVDPSLSQNEPGRVFFEEKSKRYLAEHRPQINTANSPYEFVNSTVENMICLYNSGSIKALKKCLK